MIDLETLGTKPGAAIKQIGWALFNEELQEPVILSGLIHLDLQNCLDCGLVTDASTIEWWLEQGKEARDSMTKPGIKLSKALDELDTVWRIVGASQVWAKPPGFDIAILDVAYRKLGRTAPWPHNKVRCMRTLLDLVPKGKTFKPVVAHNAEHDSIAQALTVSNRLVRLK